MRTYKKIACMHPGSPAGSYLTGAAQLGRAGASAKCPGRFRPEAKSWLHGTMSALQLPPCAPHPRRLPGVSLIRDTCACRSCKGPASAHLELLLVCWWGHLGDRLQSADELVAHGSDRRAACVAAEVSLSHSGGQPAGKVLSLRSLLRSFPAIMSASAVS